MVVGRKDDSPRKVVDLEGYRSKKGISSVPPSPKNQISREECIKMLKSFGTLSDEQISLFNIPDKVYMIEGPAGALPSISSEPEKSGAKTSGCVLMDLPLPPEQPEFAIHFSNRGSSTFCTLVDKKRKIVVSNVISDGYTSRGDWGSFLYDLESAVVDSEEKQSAGTKFNFIIAKESFLKTA